MGTDALLPLSLVILPRDRGAVLVRLIVARRMAAEAARRGGTALIRAISRA